MTAIGVRGRKACHGGRVGTAILGEIEHAGGHRVVQYRNEILWLTWGGGVNGTAGLPLADGATTSATIPVTANQDLVLECSLSGISGTIESYRPGDWSGDALDDMYNIPSSTQKRVVERYWREGERLVKAGVRELLDEQGLDEPNSPDWLVLAREVRLNGRNVCRINGRTGRPFHSDVDPPAATG